MALKAPSVRTLLPGLHLLETEVEDFDVRAALLVGRERAVVWDTLAHPSQMEAVAALTGGRPLTVAYSHADWDHVWGTCALEHPEAVVAHARAAERFGSDVPEELRRRQAREPGAWDAVRLVLAGDTVESPLPMVNDAEAVAAWIAELEVWRADERVHVVVPSHGPVGGRELVDRTATYLEMLVEGRPLLLGGAPLPAFYRETHRRNVELVGSAAGRRRDDGR